jgi:hypothetical protein
MRERDQISPIENLPFDCLGGKAMQAMADADLEITVIETVSKTENRTLQKRYFMNRDGLAFITGRSQSAIDKWIGKGWIKPARKYGTYSLFALEDIDYLLRAKRFPKGNVTDLYRAAAIEWRDMPDEVRAYLDQQIAEAEAKATRRKRA